jgi:hypothetical protein
VTIHDHHGYSLVGLPSGPILSQLLRETPSLQVLEFNEFLFKEEDCRALETLQRTDLKIKLRRCSLDPQGADDTFIEWFRHNEVVTELNRCYYRNSSIICALSGNKAIKKFSMERYPGGFADEEEISSLAQALPGNRGIEHLTLCDFHSRIETWSLLVSSLATHPRIKLVSICFRFPSLISGQSKCTLMSAIIQMLQRNTVVETIKLLPGAFNDEEVYRNSILPRLEMNRTCFEVQRQAVKRADLSIRPQLLGRALHVVRYNPNLVFQFLFENVPAFVRIEEQEEASAIPLQAIVSGQKRKVPE